MNGLDYYTRQKSRLLSLQQTPIKTWRIGTSYEWHEVAYAEHGRLELTPLERVELESLRRELDVLEPSRTH